jgi:sulfur carrier protein
MNSLENAQSPIQITLNGLPISVPPGTCVADLVQRALPNARAYAVEVNRAVLSRRDHANRSVQHGDHIEIVTLVGGG